MMKIQDTMLAKRLRSDDYNFNFSKVDGTFMRWGKTYEDDPEWSPFGPEILDLEISTGACLGRCAFCYKCNGEPKAPTKHMTLETFVRIMERMPKTLTQIAFGITDIGSNPDFFHMMTVAREVYDVIPNFTTHGLDLTDKDADRIAQLCGAVAVSIVRKDASYDAVKRLTDRGMSQVNIHFMLSRERLAKAYDLLRDIKYDPRLAKLNAVVFLQYKPKGNNIGSFTSPSQTEFSQLITTCESMGIRFGFDSCSAPMYLQAIKGRPDYEKFAVCAEPCESGLFSSYINVDGRFFACSFCEGQYAGTDMDWVKGIDVLKYDSFNDIWQSPKLDKWRKVLLSNGRRCPMYNLGG